MSPRCCPPPPPLDTGRYPDEEIAQVAKAIAHPARVKILRFLLEREECVVGAIVDRIPLAQSTISQHLKVLREAGLIHGEVDGTRICYCADRTRIDRLRGLLDALGAPASVVSGASSW